MDACEDISAALFKVGQGLEQAAKEAARKEAVEGGAIRASLQQLDAFIGMNGDGRHCVGKSITVADFFVAVTTTSFIDGLVDGVPANALDSFKHIQAVRKTVASQPAIVKWIDSSANEKARFWKEMRDL